MQNMNGINMLDVKKRNRSSLLNLVYHTDGISRKEIAARLGLTPAAITLITNDMIHEGILAEQAAEQNTSKKGRKEVSLGILKSNFAAVGIYISQHKFRILCTDLGQNTIFSDIVYTGDCHGESRRILDKISIVLQDYLKHYDVLRSHKLIGIGVSIHGIVDTEKGISTHSYYITEDNANISEYLQNIFHVPVILTNNICALAHAESFLSGSDFKEDILVVKYGPGVGAARFSKRTPSNYNDFEAVQLGHMIMDPDGQPCICGNQGCLETIAHYDHIERTLSGVINADNAPTLWQLSGGNPATINMARIIKAYEANDPIVVRTCDRVIRHLALAIRNAVCLFAPQKIILYGEPFENQKFRSTLSGELAKYTNTENVIFSQYNMQLDTLGPVTTAISYFLDSGGTLE